MGTWNPQTGSRGRSLGQFWMECGGRGGSEGVRIESGVRQRYIMFPWLLNVYMVGVMKKVKMRMGRRRVRFLEEGRK